MLLGTLIAGLIGGGVALIRYSIWKKGVPTIVFHLRWVLALVITIIAIAVEVAIIGKVHGLIYMLDCILFLTIGQVLKDTEPMEFKAGAQSNICPSCKNKINANDSYCVNCGNKISTIKNLCEKCGSKIVEGSKYCFNCGFSFTSTIIEIKNQCPNCKRMTAETEKYCVDCGYKLK